ncbi:nucleotide kinase domain-containing protein [Sphingosinicella sp.]|uniref:nucleotide kinase domain-containing protein n=1 Tax=Sphingosinicella sp. TaxID=1917971 RepID=UPI004037718C
MASTPIPTEVFDTYWRFAAERMSIYYKRLADAYGPWTDDPILQTYRFTNAYRAADRVSQYLIREVQYREDRSQAPAELFFRTMLFKFFNKIETWELIEHALGGVSWQAANLELVSRALHGASQRGARIYNAAYIMPSPSFGFARKYDNHLALLQKMMEGSLPARLQRAGSLREVYQLILEYPGLGPFLAFQYAIDLNYSSLLNFQEDDFVVAGPGALDGISKCFFDIRGRSPEDIIYLMSDRQEAEFRRLGLDFPGLFGRSLKPIDCQNLFCEISKYARVAHPHVAGASGRTRIKQQYQKRSAPQRAPFFPPRWNLDVTKTRDAPPVQGLLI